MLVVDDGDIGLEQGPMLQILSEPVSLDGGNFFIKGLLSLIQAEWSVAILGGKNIIKVPFSIYSYLVIVVNNSSSKLHYSNVIIQEGVLVVWVFICLLYLYRFFVLCVVSNFAKFYLKLKIEIEIFIVFKISF